NGQLEAILAKDELGPEDTAKIHELTYTLENALARIESEVEALEETLEEVHVASERYEVETVRTQGRKYLDNAAKLTKEERRAARRCHHTTGAGAHETRDPFAQQQAVLHAPAGRGGATARPHRPRARPAALLHAHRQGRLRAALQGPVAG